eukprot:4004596-Pyramimonas_sp.AAC.1
MDQSDTGSTGIFSRRANRIIHHGTGTPEGYGRAPNCEAAPAPPAGGPIGRRKHGYILTMDQSDAESTVAFSRRANRIIHHGTRTLRLLTR